MPEPVTILTLATAGILLFIQIFKVVGKKRFTSSCMVKDEDLDKIEHTLEEVNKDLKEVRKNSIGDSIHAPDHGLASKRIHELKLEHDNYRMDLPK